MRRMTVACVAVGIVAGAAFADGEALEFRISNELSPAQPRATVEVWTRFDPSDYAFAGAQFSVLGGEVGWLPLTLRAFGPPPAEPPLAGEIVGADVVGILVGQLHFPPPILADRSNPIWVWSGDFEVADFTPRSISLATMTTRFAVYISATSSASERRTPAEGAGEIIVVPAPGAGIALVGAGLVGMRRRAR